jgi:uncharacterized protein (DUF1919 family)
MLTQKLNTAPYVNHVMWRSKEMKEHKSLGRVKHYLEKLKPRSLLPYNETHQGKTKWYLEQQRMQND